LLSYGVMKDANSMAVAMRVAVRDTSRLLKKA
jgi:hypothetical protein